MNKMLCHKNKTLLEVLRVIHKNGKSIAFIVDDDNKVCGVLTDGDIRNLLLKGYKLQENIDKVMNKKFVYAFNTDDPSEILKKTSDRIKIIPVVDSDFKYVDFLEYSSNIYIPVAAPELTGNELKYLTDAFLSTWISSTGEYINLFEQKFAEFCETKYGVAVSNGTAAIHLALLALGIGKGDEVIVPDLTFAATINPVLHCNATPVIVDIDPISWCIDPKEIEKAITTKTKAIITVHLYGQPCDMDAINHIAKKHKLFVIEDCAEAHGARFNGKKAGSMGIIGCYSFYGNKILTTGEGGMCVTNSIEIADRIKVFKDHGMSKTKKYWHEVIGYNYRMTNLQAAIGVAQLEHIDSILLFRKELEEKYIGSLGEIQGLEFQKNDLPGREKITWLVSALWKNGNRDKLLAILKENDIDTRPFFYPLSSMELYKNYVFSNKNSLEISKMGLIFPTGSEVNASILNKIKTILQSIN
jgi:perosamine synthetase